MLWQDARIYQILFLSSFLLLGIGTRDWTLQPGMVLTAIATCLATQWIAEWLKHRSEHQPLLLSATQESLSLTEEYSPEAGQSSGQTAVGMVGFPLPRFLLSPLITGLGLSLLLRTDQYSAMILAAIAAVSSKFLLHVNGKHIFNPANIGIVAAVTLTHHAWVSPGQWGEESWYALLFISAGGVVLQRVGRWDTTIAFLGSYAALEAIRNLWLGWTWDVWLHRLMSGSLLLFALFMVTDPRTIPNARTARLIWAFAIALLAFVLRNYFFVSTAVFWALFALSPLTLFFDAFWKSELFQWQAPKATPDFIQSSSPDL